MPDELIKYILLFCSIVATLFSILIGKYVFKIGVEHISSRMLITSGVLNVFFCIFLIIIQAITSTSISIFERFLLGLLSFLIPVRIIWNYYKQTNIITAQFSLKQCNDEIIKAKIESISDKMGISPPEIVSSESISMPFVFGKRSSKAVLAVPVKWQTLDDNYINNPILLHELAHIRNHDIGFLAWTQACLKDLRYFFLLGPFPAALSYISEEPLFASALWIYISCLIVLYGLLKYILRKRELLADMTAAFLIESDNLEYAITSTPINIFTGNIGSTHNFKKKNEDSLHRWLTDKALFSKHSKQWVVLLKIANFFKLSHPQRDIRSDNIMSINQINNPSDVSLLDSFWIGITLGFLGVTVGLCGYWLSNPTQYAPDDTKIINLPFTLYGLATWFVVCFLTIFQSLPYWTSLINPSINRNFFCVLLKQYCVIFISALITSLLIFITSSILLHSIMIFFLCVMWYLMIFPITICLSIISIYAWNLVRFTQATDIKAFAGAFRTFAPLIILSVGAAVLGMSWISNDQVVQGTSLVFGTLTGLILMLIIMGPTRFSEDDYYIIISCAPFSLNIEGEIFPKYYKLFGVGIFPTLLLCFIILLYLGISWLFHNMFENFGAFWATASIIMISCMLLIFLQKAERGKSAQNLWEKSHALFHCLNIFSKPISTNITNKIICIIKANKLKKDKYLKYPKNLTANDIYEIYQFAKVNCPYLSQKATNWIFQCQGPVGFGLWPQSSPRLISTYQALTILKDSDHMGVINQTEHAAWLQSCQQEDGSFKGPWSKRNIWEDTFYAVKSLELLNASLPAKSVELCSKYCQQTLSEGIAKDQIDMSYFSVAALDALDKLDENKLLDSSKWLQITFEKLLLTNIGLNYENVHHAVMTYHILNQITPQTSMAPQIELLSERILSALDAELADIRCK